MSIGLKSRKDWRDTNSSHQFYSRLAQSDLERRSSKAQDVGSIPTSAAIFISDFSRLAQRRERLSYKQNVEGSNPSSTTNFYFQAI